MTETGSGVVYDGVPLDDVEVAIAHFDDDADEGEILLRAPMLMRCYRDGTTAGSQVPTARAPGSPPATPATSPKTARCRSLGGSPKMITTGGEKVWPDEVERVLSDPPRRGRGGGVEAPGSRVGRAGGGLGRARRRRPAHRGAEGLVADTVAPWAAPKEIVFTAELPRTASGKVLRRALR